MFAAAKGWLDAGKLIDLACCIDVDGHVDDLGFAVVAIHFEAGGGYAFVEMAFAKPMVSGSVEVAALLVGHGGVVQSVLGVASCWLRVASVLRVVRCALRGVLQAIDALLG